ncbi:MAG: lipopolysaccharide modification acyltransferase [Phycisphaerales bacterium]|nr:lipopolysaccharide modification acyltransferase [Phycisphaerales bacterium]
MGLDAVRAVAICLVLAGHFLFAYTQVSPSLLFVFGTLGVEIFFVLSGYLIGGILLNSIRANQNVVTPGLIATFWYRRWMRTVPNYVLFVIVYRLIEGPVGLRRLASYLVFTQNLAWPMPSHPQFFIVSWSLTVEEWFYITLPVLILVLYRLTGRVRYGFLMSVGFLLLVPMVLRLSFTPGRPWDMYARKIVVLRLDSLMWGVLVAALERYRADLFGRLTRWWVALLGISIVLLSAAFLMKRVEFADGSGDFLARRIHLFILPLINIGCALALPLCSVLQRPSGVLGWITLRISLWSYSLYLCHVAVITLAERTNWGEATRGIVALVGCFAVAAGVYYCFEAPILRLRDRPRRAKALEATPVADAS